MKPHWIASIVLSIFVLVLYGCSDQSRPDGFPKVHPFELTIVGEGVPLADAMVSLYSDDPDYKWGVGGVTNDRGTIKMATHGRYIGVPEGEYIVTISKLERDDFDPAKPPKKIKVFTYTKAELTERDTSPLRVNVVKGKRSETLDIGKIERKFLRWEDTF